MVRSSAFEVRSSLAAANHPTIRSSQLLRSKIIHRQVRERTDSGYQGLLVDKEQWRVVRGGFSHLIFRRDPEEDEEAWCLALEVREVFRAGDQFRFLHQAGRRLLE